MKKFLLSLTACFMVFLASAADPCITNVTFKATDLGSCSNSLSVPLVICEGVRVLPDTNGVYTIKCGISTYNAACSNAITSITIGFDRGCCTNNLKTVGVITYYLQGSKRTDTLVMPAGRHLGTWMVAADSYGPFCEQSYLFSRLCFSTPCNETDQE